MSCPQWIQWPANEVVAFHLLSLYTQNCMIMIGPDQNLTILTLYCLQQEHFCMLNHDELYSMYADSSENVLSSKAQLKNLLTIPEAICHAN